MMRNRFEDDWDAWENRIAQLEASIAPKRKVLLNRIAHSWITLQQGLYELPGLQVGMQMNERHVQGHDPLKISLFAMARDVTDRSISLYRRMVKHGRTVLMLRLISRRLAHYNFGVELNSTSMRSLSRAAGELEIGHERLKCQVDELEAEIDQLRFDYERYLIEENIWQAAHSFGPERLPGEKPWEGLARLLKGIAIQTRQDPDRDRSLERSQQVYSRRADSLLSDCGVLIDQGLAAASPKRSSTLKKIKKTLHEIRRLEQDMEDSLTAAAMSGPNSSLLVKKSQDSDRTS